MNQLAIRDFKEIAQIGSAMAQSGYFSDAAKSAQAIVKILAGREMGFGPFASMNGIHIIKGKPAIGANLMASAVRSHPKYDYRVKTLTPELCEIVFYYNGEEVGVSSFSIEDARLAGVGGVKPPGKPGTMLSMHPRNMLFSRAMSNGVRWYCPDVFSGNAVYTPDEISDVIVETPTPPVVVAETQPSPHTTPEFDAEADAEVVAGLVEDARAEAVTNAKQIGAALRKAAGWQIADGAWQRPGGDVVGVGMAAKKVAVVLTKVLQHIPGADAEKPHHALLNFLFRVPSAKMLTEAEARAILDRWTAGDPWTPTADARVEVRVLFNAAMEAAGQMRLPV